MQYSKTVIPIVREARKLLLPYWGTVDIIAQKDASSPVSVVTKLDFAVEKQVAERLAQVYPHIPFIGEEYGGDREASRFWLMDPIDGTNHFVRGLPFCTSMVALVEEGQVIFSAIYDFVNDRMYWAERGFGAYCETERLSVSKRPLSEAYICWESRIENPDNLALFLKLYEKAILLKTVASGWEYAMIASGKLDARICFDPYSKDYDFAAGSLMVSEAGGVVANIGSKEYDHKNLNFIAANPIIYSELTEKADSLFHK